MSDLTTAQEALETKLRDKKYWCATMGASGFDIYLTHDECRTLLVALNAAPAAVSSGAPSREAIARVIDPFPWDRRDLGMVGRGDEASIDRSLKIADAIRALREEQNADR